MNWGVIPKIQIEPCEGCECLECAQLQSQRDELLSSLALAREALEDIAAWDFLPNASQWYSMKKAREALGKMK